MRRESLWWGAREWAKTATFTAYTATIAPLRARRLARRGAQRVSVLCYHRVNDTLKDSVTLPVESFEQQMALIKRRYQLASIGDIVEGRLDRASGRAIVAVTFDDGYLDNYESAVPILKEHGIPAGFFVSTGLIGTDRGFRHDLERLGVALPTMTWPQLREMHAEGFEIGSHTVNHVNLAEIGEAEARRELMEARDTIRMEIGIENVAFAYCFGGRGDITPARRALVKELGYTCCLAAFGGTNEGPIDLYNIKRFGVNWRMSAAAFQARIEGWA
jgi:peptidoglycan/xylan/chitin deacetylase (PgdA/CDA1 family)